MSLLQNIFREDPYKHRKNLANVLRGNHPDLTGPNNPVFNAPACMLGYESYADLLKQADDERQKQTLKIAAMAEKKRQAAQKEMEDAEAMAAEAAAAESTRRDLSAHLDALMARREALAKNLESLPNTIDDCVSYAIKVQCTPGDSTDVAKWYDNALRQIALFRAHAEILPKSIELMDTRIAGVRAELEALEAK